MLHIVVLLQGNVGPAAFWLLAFLLTHSEAMRAVRKEFNSVTVPGTNTLNPQDQTPVFGKFYTRLKKNRDSICLLHLF